ncbi:sugar transporter [Meira miltonrushii]|uniref:Sugar transporter n=1 Tax=Meira miltonrushii TaxID=1280837 RepID=A0A316VAZ9_9BASI|nr:sugar transporter [Meira miltonrushii]PWN34640.1 sugar transporter [Meira miltonrushii]
MSSLSSSEGIARIDEDVAVKIATAVGNQVIQDAKEATESEISMGFMEAIRTYPLAVLYSVGISMAIVMESYDTMLLGNFFAQPAFQKKFGICASNGKCQVAASWQSGLSDGAQVGSIIGLLSVGWLTDKWGYRKTMIYSLICMAAFNFIVFFADNLVTLLIGNILMGLPWGVYQSLAVSYAADVCPVALRPILTSYVNFCWGAGHLIAAGVLRSTVERKDEWAWRIPYAIQWIWPPLVLVIALLCPESPWFLVRKGRIAEAEVAVYRLQGVNGTKEQAKKTVAMLMHTNELEIAATEGATYLDCFKNTAARRTEIAVMVWLAQQFTGWVLARYATYYLVTAGVPATHAFDLNIGNQAIQIIGTMSAWFTMMWFGRRALYLVGEILMWFNLLAVGIVYCLGVTPYATGGLLLLLVLIYSCTIGPCCYTLVAEIGSTRLRAKTVGIARIGYNVAGIVIASVSPYMLNPKAWNLGGKSAFIWMFTGLIVIIWTFFRLPETKNRSYSELDVLFNNKVPARKFKTTKVNQFGQENSSEDTEEKLKHAVIDGEAVIPTLMA